MIAGDNFSGGRVKSTLSIATITSGMDMMFDATISAMPPTRTPTTDRPIRPPILQMRKNSPDLRVKIAVKGAFGKAPFLMLPSK
jgi:hypothetical protein